MAGASSSSSSAGRAARWLKAGVLVGATTLGLYEVDTHFYSRTFQRNLRTILNGAIIIADYKLNFTPEKAASIGDLHERVAQRIYDVCVQNAGLYIKFGQQVASMNHIAPPQYNRIFRNLYDNAPVVGFDEVVQLIKEDFGKHPDEIFDDFEREPIASASIAQVHRARLKGTSQRVAVKVQKPYIRDQMNWDLAVYKLVLYVFEYLFDLPIVWSAEYIQRHLREEVDFINEGRNSEKCLANIASAPFADRIHVPTVYWETTSPRVLTTEWIDGIKFSDPKKVTESGYSVKEVMELGVALFAHQIFLSGFLHCDPHPGNILIRPMPPGSPSSSSSLFWKIVGLVRKEKPSPQIVLLDHGLYVTESEEFRHQYCLFWKSMFVQDTEMVQTIAEQWGIKDAQILASASLQKPYNPKRAVHLSGGNNFEFKDVYEMQVAAKERFRSWLSNTELLPRELLLVGRNMNLVRSNNKEMGSPANRINIMAEWAVKGLADDWSNWGTLTDKQDEKMRLGSNSDGWYHYVRGAAKARWHYLRFQASLFAISLGFHLTRAKQFVEEFISGKPSKGFEDLMDAKMRQAMEQQFGIVIDESAFDA